MISVYQLKPKFQQLLRPLVNGLANKGATANEVTVFAMLLSVVTGTAIVISNSLLALLALPIVLLTRMALNAIDGMLAREHNQQSKLGAYLNEIGDVISDLFLILPLLIIPDINLWLLATFAFVALLTEFAGVLGVLVEAERQYQGPMGKSDRALVLGLIGLLVPLFALPTVYLNAALTVAIILSVWTVINRIRAAL
ncbi:CDP-alcohol phosphatidyltransferase family protein [Kangiella koreensis]|uniref:CDP-alcohol phosphatidyltransferase n=1 Tax=Kangiella koreensis (strain DSM 16069 / JCM 12317 / KCTC 12182 / SW-125) TaxID=523791 RepID=C7R6E5_KANKD|nr:CDP-alcohol phosphatidyltransferase family protein [Kangiella koreensis]ACV27373.1 CDP-alcohol phosphatidyltransferase [Kangiella koreensis DSM 16069]